MSHLTVYGGSYYSYVYARMLSAAVWNQHFEGCPIDRGAGETETPNDTCSMASLLIRNNVAPAMPNYFLVKCMHSFLLALQARLSGTAY